jgi:hypothetical protein
VRRLALALAAVFPLAALSEPPRWAKLMVERARSLIGTPYVLGGRAPGKALDCQGLVFFAAQAARPCHWRSYSVYPTRAVKSAELGTPVPGLSPVSTAALDPSLLQPGDVVMLLDPTENPAEPALTELDGTPMWVWHEGLASGDGGWINADPHTTAEEGSLIDYLREREYAGIFVTRMISGPKPTVCR